MEQKTVILVYDQVYEGIDFLDIIEKEKFEDYKQYAYTKLVDRINKTFPEAIVDSTLLINKDYMYVNFKYKNLNKCKQQKDIFGKVHLIEEGELYLKGMLGYNFIEMDLNNFLTIQK